MGGQGQKYGAAMRVFAGFIGLFLLFPTPATAYFDTGNALLTMCQGTTPFEVGSCLGTIVGHYDMMMTQGYSCGNETTKNKQQLRDIVVKYLRDNPEDRNSPAGALSYLAFMFAFDCKFPTPAPAKK